MEPRKFAEMDDRWFSGFSTKSDPLTLNVVVELYFSTNNCGLEQLYINRILTID